MPKDSQRKLTLTELLPHYQLLETHQISQVNTRSARTKTSVSQKQKKKQYLIFLGCRSHKRGLAQSDLTQFGTLLCLYIYIGIYVDKFNISLAPRERDITITNKH